MQHLARSVSVLLCVLPLVSVGLFGQAESGTVSGTITDNTGAVVPGATVTMTSVNTGQTRCTVLVPPVSMPFPAFGRTHTASRSSAKAFRSTAAK